MARLACGVVLAVAVAAPQVAGQIPGLGGSTKDELAGDLRGLLMKHMPVPLYEASPNWGHQSTSRLLRRPGRQREGPPRNDGVWRKIRVEALNPAESLVLDLRNVRSMDGKLAFQVFAAVDTKLDFTQQRWESGLKLLDASARGKARVKVTLDCEATSRVETNGLLPELVFALKVTRADLRYDNLKFDHIAGLGGEAAQILGELLHAAVNQWRPSLERDLLARANAAIVKAGDHKEVRVSLAKLFKAPKP
jgi:hypothetical protein